MTSLLLIFAFGWATAQQNREFKEVRTYFNNHRQLLANEFKKRFDNESDQEIQNTIKKDFMLFMSKMDSLENVAFVEALIKTRNRETLSKNLVSISDTTVSDNSIVEKMAEYPGGLEAVRKTVAELFYDNSVYEQKILKTNVRFIVERDGSITNVVAKGENPIFNRQAEIALYLLPEKFTPGIVKGVAIRSVFRIPLTMNFE